MSVFVFDVSFEDLVFQKSGSPLTKELNFGRSITFALNHLKHCFKLGLIVSIPFNSFE
jgi:hypothetical protein